MNKYIRIDENNIVIDKLEVAGTLNFPFIKVDNFLDDEAGKVVVYENNTLQHKVDNRGKTIYSTTDKTESKVDYLGDIKLGFTLIEPNEFDEWNSKNKKWVENTAKKTEAKAINKILSIENHIYKYYPKKKQDQDRVWESSFTTKLKAGGIENLEQVIVSSAKSINSGSEFENVVTDFILSLSDEIINNFYGKTKDEKIGYIQSMFSKLLKIAIKTEWAEMCIISGKKAISSGSELSFPEYPFNKE
jgi:hypothetical protein